MTLRHSITVPVTASILGLVLGACSTSGDPQKTGAAGQSGGGAGTTVAGAGTSGGTAGISAAGGTSGAGSSGTSGAQGGAGTSATAGTQGSTPDAGPGNDATTVTDGNVGDFPHGACAPGAIFCDDFESYLVQPAFNGNVLRDFIKIGETTPTWLGYHFHGPPYVVKNAVFGGAQVYQLDTESGHPVGADIIKEAPDGTDLWPAAHYGRFMVNLKAMPPKSAWGMMSESGLLPGSPNEAQFTLGGVNGKLSFTYAVRKRPFKNDVATPLMRLGGGVENTNEAWTTQCSVNATTETLPTAKWVCVEWMLDRTKPAFHMWIDGVAQTEIDVNGTPAGATCAAGTAGPWAGPEHFTEQLLGWEVYGNDGPGWGAQYDMFAVGTQKLGCP